MAASGQNPFSCAVCLDTWRDPVTIPCGHNYCMHCISACWDKEDEKGVYSCPLCSQSFSPRPSLSKNTVLAELMENMKVQNVTTTSVASVACYAEPGDVECDFCTGRKLKAAQSCLACLASMCETHLQPHLDVPALRKHKLVKARAGLQDRVCAKHNKPLEVFCCIDQTCICMLCTMDDHKGHQTTSVAGERAHKQNQVTETRSHFQKNIQETETTLQTLRDTMGHHKTMSEETLAHSEKIFNELLQYFEGKRSEVRELISAQQKQAGLNAEEMVQELEQRSTELKRGDAELAELCHEEDHSWFLQRFHTFKNSPALKTSPIMILTVSKYFEDLCQCLSALTQTLESACDLDMLKVSAKIKEIEIARQLPLREDLLKYSCRLTLDQNTASKVAVLSEGNTKVTAQQHTGLSCGFFSKVVGSSTFGQPTAQPNTGSLFGSAGTSGFGQPTSQQNTGGLFGSTATSGFGQPTVQQNTGGLFGSTASSSSTSRFTLDQPKAQQNTGSLFGPIASSGFDQPTSQQNTGGLFCSTAGSGFGQPTAQQNTGGLFGSTGSFTFGQPKAQQNTGGLFGSTATSGFGQPTAQQNTGGLFGSTATSGSTRSFTFGQPGGLFGSTASSSSTSRFTLGQPKAQQNTGSLFGSTASSGFDQPTSQQNTGGLFGSTASSGFGQPTAQQNTGGLFGSTASSSFTKNSTDNFTQGSGPRLGASNARPFLFCQVLCEQGLTGQCYWEVERSNGKEIDIGVAYKDICNIEFSRRLGLNDKSWSLSFKSEGCSFLHHGNKTDIIGLIPGNRIGVFLDNKEGTLSFYDVSGMITLLRRVHTKFSEPLYPGFWLEEGASIKILNSGLPPNNSFGQA